MFIDEELVAEANEKGASWLLSVMAPNSELYICRFENMGEEMLVYDSGKAVGEVRNYKKEFKLGDRSITALVEDRSKPKREDMGGGREWVFFVYDDILVWAVSDPGVLDTYLPDITFFEVDMPTNTALRNTPGREGTVYSDGRVSSSRSNNSVSDDRSSGERG